MKKLILTLILTGSLNVFGQETYVIVHGAWGGGWQWKSIDSLLTNMGHEVLRPTLTGLGEKVHLAHKGINLSVHTNDIINTILFEELNEVVLIGHSYGGMVVTAVLERIPERIKTVIYLDALFPEDGESLMDAMEHDMEGGIMNMEKEGFLIPPWVTRDKAIPYDVPHPVASLTEKISLKNAKRESVKGRYILTVEEGKENHADDFYKFYLRAQAKGFETVVFTGGHNPHWFRAEELLPFLIMN